MSVDLVMEMRSLVGTLRRRKLHRSAEMVTETIAEVERLRAEVEWWHKYDSELRDNNPCPDLALRHHYLQKAREAATKGAPQ